MGGPLRLCHAKFQSAAAHRRRNCGAGLLQFPHIRARLRHRYGNGVRREHQPSLRQLFQRRARRDPPSPPEISDARKTAGSCRSPARSRPPHGPARCSRYTAGTRSTIRTPRSRTPAPAARRRRASAARYRAAADASCGCPSRSAANRSALSSSGPISAAILIVDGAAAVEVIIMLGHFQHPLARHIPPAQDVFEKRNHVFVFLRTAEGDDQQGVVGGHTPILEGSC